MSVEMLILDLDDPRAARWPEDIIPQMVKRFEARKADGYLPSVGIGPVIPGDTDKPIAFIDGLRASPDNRRLFARMDFHASACALIGDEAELLSVRLMPDDLQ